MSKRILILSANPEGTSALDLDTEKREIRQALKGSDFTIETRGAVRPADLQQALLEVQPQIVHFCGHGEGTDGIALGTAKSGIVLLTSAQTGELSNEGKQWGDGHGVFTHFVLEYRQKSCHKFICKSNINICGCYDYTFIIIQ